MTGVWGSRVVNEGVLAHACTRTLFGTRVPWVIVGSHQRRHGCACGAPPVSASARASPGAAFEEAWPALVPFGSSTVTPRSASDNLTATQYDWAKETMSEQGIYMKRRA